jgi:hypothetical protein
MSVTLMNALDRRVESLSDAHQFFPCWKPEVASPRFRLVRPSSARFEYDGDEFEYGEDDTEDWGDFDGSDNLDEDVDEDEDDDGDIGGGGDEDDEDEDEDEDEEDDRQVGEVVVTGEVEAAEDQDENDQKGSSNDDDEEEETGEEIESGDEWFYAVVRKVAGMGDIPMSSATVRHHVGLLLPRVDGKRFFECAIEMGISVARAFPLEEFANTINYLLTDMENHASHGTKWPRRSSLMAGHVGFPLATFKELPVDLSVHAR